MIVGHLSMSPQTMHMESDKTHTLLNDISKTKRQQLIDLILF